MAWSRRATPRGGGASTSAYATIFAICGKAIRLSLMGIGTVITVVFLALVTGRSPVWRWRAAPRAACV